MLTLGKLGLCLAGLRLLPLTILALLGFATNSLLTRAAIRAGHLDAWTFMVVRLVTGAIMLWVLVALRGEKTTSEVVLGGRLQELPQRSFSRPRSFSSWLMAIWLAGYAVLFTLAYVRIEAGPGALLLFGSVQLTMFGAALARGETLSVRHGFGVALALAGFLVLTLPGLSAPDPWGAVLMAGAGACWGAYSLAGRGATDPLGATADNFLRAAVIGVLVALAAGPPGVMYTFTGLALASASGAFASGLAYAAWYAVLPALPVWRAATVQLAVPVLTALAATIFLSERMTWRLSASMVLVVAGIGLATTSRGRSR